MCVKENVIFTAIDKQGGVSFWLYGIILRVIIIITKLRIPSAEFLDTNRENSLESNQFIVMSLLVQLTGKIVWNQPYMLYFIYRESLVTANTMSILKEPLSPLME